MVAAAAPRHAGCMDADQLLSLLVATDAGLLLILALVAKKRLEWKRPATKQISPRLRRWRRSLSSRPPAGWWPRLRKRG